MSLVGKIKTITGNCDYRVRDVVDKKGQRWQHSARQVKCNPKYDGTILQTYVKLVEEHNEISLPASKLGLRPPHRKEAEHICNTRSLLLRLIKERVEETGMDCPETNELVIHLRLGDIIADPKWQKLSLSNNKPDVQTAKRSGLTASKQRQVGGSRSSPEEVIIDRIGKYISRHPEINKITIITCFAYQDWSDGAKKEYREKNPKGTKDLSLFGWTQKKHEYNISYFMRLESKIRKRFPKVQLDLRSSFTIDDDMCYASLANNFMPSLGGFTELLSELSAMNKNDSASTLDFLPEGRLMESILPISNDNRDFLSLNPSEASDVRKMKKVLVNNGIAKVTRTKLSDRLQKTDVKLKPSGGVGLGAWTMRKH